MYDIKYLNEEKTTYTEEKRIDEEDRVRVVPIIKFEPYRDEKWLTHGFSTRIGGFSSGIYSSMNLSFSQGDDERFVRKNHYLMADAFDVKPDNIVYSHQTHTTNVLRVNPEHAGMGLTKERSFHDVDGFVTDVPGLMLVTAYADCVPLYFADCSQHVIGLSHSGWRGTVNNMVQATIDRMRIEFGSRPEDIVAFIGPSICAACYEVGEDVAQKFADTYKENADKVLKLKKETAMEKKYYLNLHAANRINMLHAGIPQRNVHVTDICTCCNPDLLFSHRASKGKRGGLCGYMMINE